MTSFMQTKETVDRKWYVIDAKDQPLGRVAAKAAHILTVVTISSLLTLKNAN